MIMMECVVEFCNAANTKDTKPYQIQEIPTICFDLDILDLQIWSTRSTPWSSIKKFGPSIDPMQIVDRSLESYAPILLGIIR